MERFAIKIDKKLKANLYKICRLCGIDNPDMVPIISDKPQYNDACIDVEAELEMEQKINLLLGLSITKDDRMPQTMCCLCVDKINDFYEFREMCYATNAQTRKLLGLKNIKKPALDIKPKVEIKEESIVPTPIPIPAPASASTLNKNNKKRKSEELALKDEKPDVTPVQPKKKLRFSTSADSNIKEEALQTKKKLRFSATNEESIQPPTCSSKKSKNMTLEDTKLKKEPSPPVLAPVIPLAVSNKKLRLAAPPQKDLAIKKSKQKAGKSAETEVKEEIKEEVKDEPSATTTQLAVKVPQLPKLKFSCNICKERFAAKVNLETHRATHIPKVERYVCTACNEILGKSFDIKNHQLWHKLSKTPYICGCCGESILNTYAFSRHLREHAFDTPPALLVLDRECPQCHTSYATNFLYNIHVCAVKTRRCAGCNRLQRNDAEYLKHSAQCAKVYLNYSKHIMPSVEALEDAVRIKNENDVEAAAEEMARISGVSLDMAPVVQLTRLSSPLIMAASHAVSTTGLDDASNISSKKSSKKGVSKKDLRRVDELLKSTLDALVSIKHEPEVHVDQETPCAAEQSDSDDHHNETDDPAGGLDDFHHNNDTDSENEKTSNYATIGNEIKPSAAAEDGIAQVKIKQEIDETNEENANKIGGGLKLKIKKEHGQLNSSIIEQQKSSDKRAEKRKKKKKHKEKEKDKQKVCKDTQDEQDVNINNNSSEENVVASTIRIKVEPPDASDFGEKSTAAVLQQRPQPEATIMTSIPMMQFQIACVSSGVEFNNAANPVMDSTANHDAEPEDVKPNRQELDRMMQISHVSSGIAMETNETEENVSEAIDQVGNYDKGSGVENEYDYHEEDCGVDQHADENDTDHEEDNQSENPDEEQKESANEGQSVEGIEDNETKTVAGKIKSSLQAKPQVTSKPKESRLSVAPKSRNKACKSTSKPSNISALQISAVQSGVTLEPTTPTTTEFPAIYIKPEPQNRGYSDEQPTVTSPTRHPDHGEETENLAHAHNEEEQNYISTIDFTNIMIKQEKDLEINDVHVTQRPVKSIAKLNGVKRKRKQARDENLEQNERLENNDEYMEGEENQSDGYDEETESEEDEEEEEAEEEDDEEDEDMNEEDEHEEREYRELEYPPELTEDKHDNETEEDLKDLQETTRKEQGDEVPFVIANVCSQVSTDTSAENSTKIREEGVTLPSNNSAISDLEEKQNSEEKVDTNTSSGEELLFNVNISKKTPNTEVPNVSPLETGFEGEVENNENTHSVNPLTSQPLQTKTPCMELSMQLGVPLETDKQDSKETGNAKETHSHVEHSAQYPETNTGQPLDPEAQSHQYVDHILHDIPAAMSHETANLGSDFKQNQDTNKTENHQGTLLQSTSDIHVSKEQHNLQSTAEHSQETKSASHGLLDSLPYTQQSPSPSLQTASSEIEPCLQSNNDRDEISKDNREEDDTPTIEGVVRQSKDADLEARPVTVHFDSESADNDQNEEDEEENEPPLANNLEERQNYQNQEVLSQITPTALALHPYLEDISSSSNSLLSNSLSQTPPPPQLAASGSGVNNDLNSQRLLDTEETENILNESSEVAETLAMSVSHSLSQPMLGQPLPAQMPTFNFDNINEIAENNNNANIEREQLQDEHHQQ